MTEAAALSLASFVLLFVAAFVPATSVLLAERTRSAGTPAFTSIAVIVAAAWGLQWYSTIKLAGPSRSQRLERYAVALAWVLCALATVHVALPIIPILFGARPGILYTTGAGIAGTLAGPLCAAAFYLQLGRVFKGFGAAGLAAQASLLAVLMPLAVSRSRLFRFGSWGPLEVFVSLPSYQHGNPTSSIALFLAFEDDVYGPLLQHGLATLVPVCGTYLMARLLILCLRTRDAAPSIETRAP